MSIPLLDCPMGNATDRGIVVSVAIFKSKIDRSLLSKIRYIQNMTLPCHLHNGSRLRWTQKSNVHFILSTESVEVDSLHGKFGYESFNLSGKFIRDADKDSISSGKSARTAADS